MKIKLLLLYKIPIKHCIGIRYTSQLFRTLGCSNAIILMAPTLLVCKVLSSVWTLVLRGNRDIWEAASNQTYNTLSMVRTMENVAKISRDTCILLRLFFRECY